MCCNHKRAEDSCRIHTHTCTQLLFTIGRAKEVGERVGGCSVLWLFGAVTLRSGHFTDYVLRLTVCLCEVLQDDLLPAKMIQL